MKELKYFDIQILLITTAIVGIGSVLIYSAASGGVAYMQKQLVFACIGLLFGFLVSSIPSNLLEKSTRKLYLLNLILLTLVLIIGTNINGAKRWIDLGFMNLQPSEIAKILVIICLAVYLHSRKDEIKTPKVFYGSLLYIVVPLLLIFKEPDLGTSLVLIAIWFTMNLVMGTDIKNIIVCMLIGVCLISFAWFTPGILKDYQRQRIMTFVNPEADSLGSGYHVTQSKIAIGSGGITGKGFLEGSQRKLEFIPEQHTDFIFTVMGEEWGLRGCLTLLLLYALLIYRFIYVMLVTEDFIGRAMVAGITGMFLFHIFVNIGMTLGIMPVTGVPLILVSYGGTSLLTSLIAIGIVEGVAMRRNTITF